MENLEVRIVGTGMAVPDQAIASDDLDAKLSLPVGTVRKRTGVSKRYAARSETAAQLAARACKAALDDAGLTWSDIDCLVATSATMDQALPFNAALIHAELGLSAHRTSTFDIGASCLSFLVGLDTMGNLVKMGRYRQVMLVSADIATFGLDWNKLESSGIFGDGAAAAIIRRAAPGEDSTIHAANFVTLSEGAKLCEIPAGGSRFHPRRTSTPMDRLALFRMDGKAVFRLVSEELPGFMATLLQRAHCGLDDMSLVVPHQASRLAIDHLARRLGIATRKLMDIFGDYGNQVGASLPTALHLACKTRRVARGEKMLLLGTGAGLTIGGMVLTY
jgi:3-oxoacyl-[acyl-carrier-protein] synthase-3